MVDHPARLRVAEVLVTQAGEPRRGSGYLVASGWVLTAGHVVADAEEVAVWLGAPPMLEPSLGVGVDARRILIVADGDLALVPVGPGTTGVEPVLFGRLDRTAVKPVRVAAAGFPRFKLRPAPRRPGVELRDLHVTLGVIIAGSDAKTETLELAVDRAPPEDPQPGKHSPWEGMSGAAVWASGRLVGVVGQHHLREGPGILTVRPLSGLFEAVTAEELAAWQEALPQLVARADDLSLATLPSSRELVVRKAQRHAEALLPPVLVARDQDLADLATFAGSQQRWRWIQGAAFAGKTALLAWFALYPPEGVDVAACFLRRTTGQDHAAYALDVLTHQLAQLAERSDYRPTTDLVDDFIDLLEDAARACQQRGRRLLLLVDGLDEDQTVEHSLRVARWLPDGKTLPDNAWLLIASREGIPVPLSDHHPLLACIHKLSVSVAATKIQELAEAELAEARKAGGLVYDVLGMLAAAFGGLTVSDLTQLIQRHGQPTVSSVQVSDMLDGSLARSVSAVTDPEELEEPVRVFAHDMLFDHARTLYTRDLSTYHALFDRWAQEYQQRAWPTSTPRYLLLPYTRQLTSEALDPASPLERRRWVIETLYQISANPRRVNLLLERTGNPAVSNQEITTTQRLLIDTHELTGAGDDGDLIYRLAVLALTRQPLTGTLAEVVASVSSLWAQAGRFTSALAIALGVDDPAVRARALADVAGWLAQAGQAERAIQVAAGIEDPGQRARALADVAGRLAQAGQAERAAGLAVQAATGVQDPGRQAETLADVAGRLAQAGQAERAIQVATGIQDPKQRAETLADVAGRLAQAGQAERAAGLAVQAATSIQDSRQRALAEVAGRLARAGQAEHAVQVATGIESRKQRARALADAADGLAQAGQAERAIQVATGIQDRRQRARALAEVAGRLARAGQAEQAIQVATGIEDSQQRARALAEVAGRLSQAEQTLQVATGIQDPKQRARALADAAGMLAQAGQAEQAIQVATGIQDPKQRARALLGAAGGLVRAGRVDLAASLAIPAAQIESPLMDPGLRVGVLRNLAGILAQAGHVDQAIQVAAGIEDPGQRARALAEVAGGLVRAGQAEQAIQVATGIEDPERRARALVDVGVNLAQAGQADRAAALAAQAAQIATGIQDSRERSRALVEVAERMSRSGQADRAAALAAQAARIATGIQDSRERSRALVEVAGGLVRSGQAEQAIQVATHIEDPGQRALALVDVGGSLAQAGQADRAAALAAQAAQIATDIRFSAEGEQVLAEVAVGLARAGLAEQATQLVDLIDPWEWEAWPLGLENVRTEVAVGLARAGQAEQAIQVATGNEYRSQRGGALAEVAGRLAGGGLAERAIQVATSIEDPGQRARALVDVAGNLARAGQVDRAAALAAQAAQVATGINNAEQRAWALANAAGSLAQAGNVEQAIQVANGIEFRWVRSQALADVAEKLVHVGRAALAVDIATQAATIVSVARNFNYQARAEVAGSLARAGLAEQAIKVVVGGVENVELQTRMLAEVAGGLARARQIEHAIRIASAIDDPKERARILATIARLAEDDSLSAVMVKAISEILLSPYARAHLAAVPVPVMEQLLAEGRLV